MFASLVLAVAMHSWGPGVSLADVVTCPANHHAKLPARNSFLPPYLPSNSHAGARIEPSSTRTSDLIAFPRTGATWFQSWAGGGGAGTAHELQYGVGFGDTLGKIQSVYGGGRMVRESPRLWAVQYVKRGPMQGNLPFRTITTFYLRDGRVVGVNRISGI